MDDFYLQAEVCMEMETKRYSKYPLNGEWLFALDPAERGEKDAWHSRPDVFSKRAIVPQSIQEQNIGYLTRYDERRSISNHESFEELDPSFIISKSECYVDAWYWRTFTAPELPEGTRLYLCAGGIMPAARVFIDGQLAGAHLTGPLEEMRLDITDLARPGKEQALTIRIMEDYRLLQGVVKWPYYSGLTRDIWLEVRRPIMLGDVWVRGDIHTGLVSVIAEEYGEGVEFSYAIEAPDGAVVARGGGQMAEMTVPNHQLWDPDHPNLYRLYVTLTDGGEVADERMIRFGFRRFERRGKTLYLNDRPLFLRGTGITTSGGFPGPGEQSRPWVRKLVERVKEYGFNYLRIHTFSIDRELIEAADEMGLILQSELYSLFYETPEERRVTGEQCRLMLLRNRNHASIGTFVMGNEHDGTSPLFLSFRDELCRMARVMAPDSLVVDADGTDRVAAALHSESDICMAGIGYSIGNIFDMSPAAEHFVKTIDKPYQIHEFGYPESFPNPDDIPRYIGLIEPFWLQHTLQSAEHYGVAHLLSKYVDNSRKIHYTTVRKAIEDVRKVDGLAGYGHWGFVDFVHESIGLTNLFLDDKAGSADDFRCVNGPIILSMTPACDRMTGYIDEPFRVTLHISNHTGEALYHRTLAWQLRVDGEVVREGRQLVSAKCFGAEPVAEIELEPVRRSAPYAATLHAWLDDGVRNKWKLWFFPSREAPKFGQEVTFMKESWPTIGRLREYCSDFAGVTEAAVFDMEPGTLLIAGIVNNAVVDYLARGGDVLLMPLYYAHNNPGLPVLPASFGGMPSFAGTMGSDGTVIRPHALFQGFPQEDWCDYQYYDLLGGERIPHVCAPFHHTSPMVFDLDAWPVTINPIIRSIPNWKKCMNRAYLFEVRVGAGRLLACAMRVFENLFTHPEAEWILRGMLSYMSGPSFHPEASVSLEQFEAVRRPAAVIRE